MPRAIGGGKTVMSGLGAGSGIWKHFLFVLWTRGCMYSTVYSGTPRASDDLDSGMAIMMETC
jgi:hypothetical protein